MRCPVIRLDGIPTLEPYLLAASRPGASVRARLELAAMLLEREGYYLAIYSAHGGYAGVQPAEHDSRWLPHPATSATRARLSVLASGKWPDEEAQTALDVFGLKAQCLERLVVDLAPRPVSVATMLVAARLALDLRLFAEAKVHGEMVLGLQPGNRAALAYWYDAAVLAPAACRPRPSAMVRAERRMRRWFGPNWVGEAARAQEQHHLLLRHHAWRVRRRDEGAAFTRFLTGEREFCENERRMMAASVDPERVPDPLRELLPAALAYGVGDDSCRNRFLARMRPLQRRDLVAAVSRHAATIDAWLTTRAPPYPPEMSAYFWLRSAVDDLDLG